MLDLDNPFINVAERRVLVRSDLNLPIQNGIIQSTQRLEKALDTLKWLTTQRARVMLMSHLGRPTEGQAALEHSLAPVAEELGNRLVPLMKKRDDLQPPEAFDPSWKPRLIENYLQRPPEVAPGEVVLLENVRFNRGETANDPDLAKKYAALCDLFVLDAFGTAHRAHASTCGVIQYAPEACAGRLLAQEWNWITNFVTRPDPNSKMVTILGGAKVSSKLPVLEALTEYAHVLLPGGGIANTFLAASGYKLGDSLYERDLVPIAKRLLDKPNCEVVLPCDVRVTGPDIEDGTVRDVSDINADERVMDLGPRTLEKYTASLKTANIILWNGPLGVFEQPAFAHGTEALAKAVAASSAVSLAGGGETVAAIEKFSVKSGINHISTGGGAFLAALAREPLPAIVALEKKAAEFKPEGLELPSFE